MRRRRRTAPQRRRVFGPQAIARHAGLDPTVLHFLLNTGSGPYSDRMRAIVRRDGKKAPSALITDLEAFRRETAA